MKKEENGTFEFLIDFITTKIVGWIIRDQGKTLEEAMIIFHNSEVFEKLCIEATGLYIESPGYVYELFKEEMVRGTIRGLTE